MKATSLLTCCIVSNLWIYTTATAAVTKIKEKNCLWFRFRSNINETLWLVHSVRIYTENIHEYIQFSCLQQASYININQLVVTGTRHNPTFKSMTGENFRFYNRVFVGTELVEAGLNVLLKQESTAVGCVPPVFLSSSPVGRPPWMQTLPPQWMLVMWPVMCVGYQPTPLPWTDKHLWKHYLAPNFVCGR